MKVYRYEKKRMPSKDRYTKLMYNAFDGWSDPINMEINDKGQLVSVSFERVKVKLPNGNTGFRTRRAWSVELLFLANKMGLEVDPKVIEANERSKYNRKLSRDGRSTHKRGKNR